MLASHCLCLYFAHNHFDNYPYFNCSALHYGHIFSTKKFMVPIGLLSILQIHTHNIFDHEGGYPYLAKIQKNLA